MRLRKLALAVGLVSVLGSEVAISLGLGEIKLNSTLNQPLNAEIKLLQTRELSSDDILVGLANKIDFQNAGVDRDFFLSDLKFQVVTNSPDGPIVRVTSKKIVREPYLNFLVETQWPTGRILREYTLLMDLPVFSNDTARPIIAAVSKPAPRPVTQSAPPKPVAATETTTEEPRELSSDSEASSASSSDTYGPVKSNDTLWEIALKIRPSKKFSVQQTMLAIQRLNPEAFINGNINLLRQGQVLRVPTEMHVGALSSRQAVSEVSQQNKQWDSSEITTGPQLEASKQFASTPAKTDSVEGRLTLASSAAGEASGQSSGSSDTSDRLQNELAITLEELDKSSRENSELKDRVSELEEQISTMERLVEISSQELRALQLASKNKAPISSNIEDGVPKVEAGVVAEPQVSSVDEAITDESADVVVTENSNAVTQPVVAPEATPESVEKEPSVISMLMDNLALLGAGVMALLLAALFLFRKRDVDDEHVILDDYNAEVEPQEFDQDEDVEAGLEELDIEESIDGLDEDETSLDLEDDSFTPDSETGDAVGEADIYIAYGKFDQAEEMLLKALVNDGPSTAVSLKLMEVYSETKDINKFDGQYSAVISSDDGDVIERANELRNQFVDAPEYTAPTIESKDSLADAGDDFDLGDGLDLNAGLALDLDGQASTDDISDLDFNLDFEESESESVEQVDNEAEEFDLDLDLSLDEPDEASAHIADDEFSLDFDSTETIDTGESDFNLDFDTDNDTASEPVGIEGLDVESLDLDLDGGDILELADSESDLVEDSEESSDEFATFPEFEESDVDMDMASLDKEMEALSSNMDLASEEFGEDSELNDLSVDAKSGDLELESEGLGSDFDLSSELEVADLEVEVSEPEGLGSDFDLSSELEVADLEVEVPESEGLASDFDLSSELEVADLEVEAPESDSEGLDSDFDLSSEPEVADLDVETPESDSVELATDFDLSFDEEVEADSVEELQPEEGFDLAADLELDAADFDGETDEDVFSQALSDIPDSEASDGSDETEGSVLSDDDLDAELEFLSDSDEAGTKLDLARAYIDMGDKEGAKDILDEVAEEGNDIQKSEAAELLSRL